MAAPRRTPIHLPATSNEAYDMLPHLANASHNSSTHQHRSVLDRVLPPPSTDSAAMSTASAALIPVNYHSLHQQQAANGHSPMTARRHRTQSHDGVESEGGFSTDNDDGAMGGRNDMKWYYQNLPESLRPARMDQQQQPNSSVMFRQPKNKEYVVAVFPYEAKEKDELNLHRGSVIKVRDVSANFRLDWTMRATIERRPDDPFSINKTSKCRWCRRTRANLAASAGGRAWTRRRARRVRSRPTASN